MGVGVDGPSPVSEPLLWEGHVTGEPGPTRSLLPDFTEVCAHVRMHVCASVCVHVGGRDGPSIGNCALLSLLSLIPGTKCSESGGTSLAAAQNFPHSTPCEFG